MNNVSILNPIISIRPLVFKWTRIFKIIWIIMLISVISLLVFSIFQACSLAKENYLIKDSERKINNLTKENKTLEINFSKSNSLSNIENYLSKENFVKANQIKYIQIFESSVVTK